MNPLTEAYTTFAALAALVVVLSSVVNTQFSLKGWHARAASWGVAFACVAVGYFGNIGYLADQTLFYAVLDALGVSLVANGLFSSAPIKKGLSLTSLTSQPSVSEHVRH